MIKNYDRKNDILSIFFHIVCTFFLQFFFKQGKSRDKKSVVSLADLSFINMNIIVFNFDSDSFILANYAGIHPLGIKSNLCSIDRAFNLTSFCKILFGISQYFLRYSTSEIICQKHTLWKKKFNTIFFPDFFVRIVQNRGSKPLGANFTSSSCHPRIFTFSKNLFKYKKYFWNLKENVLFSKLKNVETVKRNMEMSFSSWKDSFEEKNLFMNYLSFSTSIYIQ